MRSAHALFTVFLVMAASSMAAGQDESSALAAEAAQALRRGVEFFRHQVASHGGYVYQYSADLAKREGEGQVGPDTVWVQPPGTPVVGMALLEAYRRTGEAFLLEGAREAAEALIQGQLRSGGWTARIEFAPEARREFAYRVDPLNPRAFNVTTFDDDKTQSAIRFLAELDRTLDERDAKLHEAVTFALDAVLKAQYPNGAWPQGFSEFPRPEDFPVLAASFPDSWPREHPGGRYYLYYTLNDNAMADTIAMLLLAADHYQEPRYRLAAFKGGDFLVLAQMPEPQPAWAQQYNFQMHPAWARRFEPPAISGSESQGVIQVLLELYRASGERRYLEPIPAAIAYLRRSQLSSGRLARFYELRTNRPLYFTRQYELTYSDDDLPTHYSFRVGSRLDALQAEYDQLAALPPDAVTALRDGEADGPSRARSEPAPSDADVRRVIQGQDERGAWVENGRLRYHGNDDETRRVITTRTFIRNIDLLSRYLAVHAGSEGSSNPP